MVRHEIDDHPQLQCVAPVQQLLKLIQTFFRIHGIVRADVEVVFDRVGTARDAF